MSSPACPIENIVVVMLENRSYDNVLGWLYNENNPPGFQTPPPGQAGLDGLTGTETNPAPDGRSDVQISKAAVTTINGAQYPATTVPAIDPGETFSDMAQQFTGTSTFPTGYPYETSPEILPMKGFVYNYELILSNTDPIDQSRCTPFHYHPGFTTNPNIGGNYSDLMTYLTPENIPATATLAKNYAVIDQWFASAPTQTFCNRAFSICASPSIHNSLLGNFALIDDISYAFPFATNEILTISCVFSALDKKFPDSTLPNWKVYYHDYAISAFTVPYVLHKAESEGNRNVSPYSNTDWGDADYRKRNDVKVSVTPETKGYPAKELGGPDWTTFADDVKNGLPKLSLIEPRYANDVSYRAINGETLAPNSNHPGASNYLGTGNPLSKDKNPPIDVTDGELLLADVYNTIASSGLWKKTLLIVTYDEPGGMYDHVSPVPIVGLEYDSKTLKVHSDYDKAANDFSFDLTGGRVPAIIISPYVTPGSTITAPEGGQVFDHTSIIKTVWDVFGLADNGGPASLTQRDLNAPSLLDYLDFSEVNPPVELPTVTPPAKPG